jgi:GNAT superfamily N-acetyltransferase
VTTPLSAFLDGPLRNEHIVAGPLVVYVRKAHHIINEKMVQCLDVASIDVPERHRGQGHFHRWLQKAEATARAYGLVVRVESILEPRLVPFLARRGYLRVPDTNPMQTDMYLPVQVEPPTAYIE